LAEAVYVGLIAWCL